VAFCSAAVGIRAASFTSSRRVGILPPSLPIVAMRVVSCRVDVDVKSWRFRDEVKWLVWLGNVRECALVLLAYKPTSDVKLVYIYSFSGTTA
jgi:hypothetical protein